MALWLCDIDCPRVGKKIAFCYEKMSPKEFIASKHKVYPVPCKYLKRRKCTWTEVSKMAGKRWKDMKTTELIDALDTMKDAEDVDKLYEELDKREAWKYLWDSIMVNDKSIEDIQTTIRDLKQHKHVDGKVVVEI
jgi:hypothetical protein